MIYKLLMPKADRLYITEIDKDFDGDSYFPEISKDEWKEVSREHAPQDENDFRYDYVIYERKEK